MGRVMCDIAYVAQEAWLRNATIRENILFGETYDQKRYEEVLRVCALKPDLRILDAGDRTEIGERGVTLSGGQKQRVALARAVYSSRRILVIDDCLSAVDAHTAKHILMECLVGQTPLMLGRTRVLVTHHVSACMPHADYMAVIHDGRVVSCGTPDTVQSQGGMSCEIQELELELSRKQQQAESNTEDEADDDGAAMLANVNDMRCEDEYVAELLVKLAEQRGSDPTTIDSAELEDMLVEDEEREHGYVRMDVWTDYLSMCGTKWFWVLMAGALLGSNSASILRSYWLRLWMGSADETNPAHSVVFWLVSYTLVGVLNQVVGQVSSIVETIGMLRAARLYHERLFARVIAATPRFFDKTPIGRVISRFSRDMSAIDDEILVQITSIASEVIEIISMIVIVSSVIPLFAIIALLLMLVYSRLAIYYMGATRELKRLGSISRSPLLSLVTEIVTGVESIRAFGMQSQYIVETMNRVDLNNQPNYLLSAASRWLSIRTSLSGSIVSFSTTILILMNLDRIDAGLAGFILMYTT
ncbi:Transporter of the ATP-binding cassette (ABC), partial [Coemansia aciculifera]